MVSDSHVNILGIEFGRWITWMRIIRSQSSVVTVWRWRSNDYQYQSINDHCFSEIPEMPSKPVDKTYSAHLPPSERPSDPSAVEPLDRFRPRKVTGEEVLKAMVQSGFIAVLCTYETPVKRMAMSTLSRNNHTRLNIRRFLNHANNCLFSIKWITLWTSWVYGSIKEILIGYP